MKHTEKESVSLQILIEQMGSNLFSFVLFRGSTQWILSVFLAIQSVSYRNCLFFGWSDGAISLPYLCNL